MLLNEKSLDYILVILICCVMPFAFLMVPLPACCCSPLVMPLVMRSIGDPFLMLVRSMMPLAILMRSMVPVTALMMSMMPFTMWAIVVATAIPAAALVALYHLLVLLALGLLLVPI